MRSIPRVSLMQELGLYNNSFQCAAQSESCSCGNELGYNYMAQYDTSTVLCSSLGIVIFDNVQKEKKNRPPTPLALVWFVLTKYVQNVFAKLNVPSEQKSIVLNFADKLSDNL